MADVMREGVHAGNEAVDCSAEALLSAPCDA